MAESFLLFTKSSILLVFLKYYLKCLILTSCITKIIHVWKYHLIFFFCNFIIGAAQHAWHHESYQGTQKYCAPEFLNISVLKLPSSEMVVFIVTNLYTLTEGCNFKTPLKENYAIALDSCCMFIKKNVEHEVEPDAGSAYGFCIH